MISINSIDVRKFIIAQYGVDVTHLFRDQDLMDGMISVYSKKRAADILNGIKGKNNGDPTLTAKEIMDYIFNLAGQSPRGKRFAIILLLMAKASNLISNDNYRQARELWGFNKYSPEIQKALEGEPEAKDDFKQLF